MRRCVLCVLALCLAITGLTTSCDDRTPTASEPGAELSLATSASEAPQSLSISVDALRRSTAADEQFNCTNLSDRHVRFTSSGEADPNVAELFYSFEGVPGESALLSIIWDEEDAPDVYELLRLDGMGTTSGDVTDYEGTVTHEYDVSETTIKVVRTALIVTGMTGDCSTVRRIEVSPAPTPPPPAKPSCGLTTGGGWLGTFTTTTICSCPLTGQTINWNPDFINLCNTGGFGGAIWVNGGECFCF